MNIFSSKQETVSDILSQFTVAYNKLQNLISRENDKIATSYNIIDEEEAKIEASLTEIDAATKASEKLKELVPVAE